MARLPQNFYAGDTVETARAVLGKYLVRVYRGEALVGRITETEAYVAAVDKACHAYGGRRTPRTETLFGPPGRAYIYFIYGMYHCLNLVTEPTGTASAVLIRGLEAVAGVETIRTLRFGEGAEMSAYRRKNFLNGPGKICKGLGLSKAENGIDLTGGTLFLCDCPADAGLKNPPKKRARICSGPRIGVDYAQEAAAFPWRFWLKEV